MVKGVGEVLLITSDVGNQNRSKEQRLVSMSMHAFVHNFLNQYPDLIDLLANDVAAVSTYNKAIAGGEGGGGGVDHLTFPPHISSTEISAG